VHIYVDGVRTIVPTGGVRPDVAAVFPPLGAAHGFATFIGGLGAGAHGLCAYGINTGPGTNALIGCQDFTVPTGSPWGALDDLSTSASMITAAGWTIDPDTKGALSVHVYIDGVKAGETLASLGRADVAAAFPVFGLGHGFHATFGGITGGTHTVCAYGINVAAGSNALVGCATITTSGVPFGSLDMATGTNAGTTLAVSGWAIDPDTTASLAVHVYVDGVGRAILTANQSRPDVAAVFPNYGSAHGYSATITGLPAGSHRVCAYGINVAGGGVNPELGCATL